MKITILFLFLSLVLVSCGSDSDSSSTSRTNDNNPDVQRSEESLEVEDPVADTNEEKVEDGMFSKLDEWNLGLNSSNSTVFEGRLRLVSNDGNVGAGVFADQTIDTVVGVEYTVTYNTNVTGIGSNSSRVEALSDQGASLGFDQTTDSGEQIGRSFTFIAASQTTRLRLSWNPVNAGANSFNEFWAVSAVRNGGPQNSNKTINMGTLSQVGDSVEKRIYIENNSSSDLILDFDSLKGSGLSMESASSCQANLQSSDRCYIDVRYQLASENQVSMGTVVVDFVSNKPEGSTADWGRISLIGNLSAEIEDGTAKELDMQFSREMINFGKVEEDESKTERIYLSNNTDNTMTNLTVTVDEPYKKVSSSCKNDLEERKLCYVDVKYDYAENESFSLEDELKITATHDADNEGVSSMLLARSDDGELDAQFSSAIPFRDGPEVDYTDLQVGESKTVRLYFTNNNGSYDFGANPPIVIGDLVIERTSCSGVILENNSCFMDVTYTKKQEPAFNSQITISSGLNFEFASPGDE